MRRINTATSVGGRFVDGNKTTGRKATQFSAEWCNQIQEEIAGLLESNGVTLGASENQLVALFSKFFASGFDSIRMSKDGRTMEADGKELKYKVVGQGQGTRTNESIVYSLGLLAKVYGIGSARYQSNRITFYDEEDNEVVKLEFDPVEGLIVKDAEGNAGVFRAGTFIATNVVASGLVKSYSGPNRPSSSQYFEFGPMGIVLNSGPGQHPSNLVIERDSSSNGYNVTGIKDLTISGYFCGKNTILATSGVDLTSSQYSSFAAGTELTIVNDGDRGVVVVTWDTGMTENISSSSARKYVKKTNGWARLFALDPTAPH